MEADSYGWHRSPGALNADRERDVELVLAGYRVLRFTYEQVTRRPDYVIQAILRALGARAITACVDVQRPASRTPSGAC